MRVVSRDVTGARLHLFKTTRVGCSLRKARRRFARHCRSISDRRLFCACRQLPLVEPLRRRRQLRSWLPGPAQGSGLHGAVRAFPDGVHTGRSSLSSHSLRPFLRLALFLFCLFSVLRPRFLFEDPRGVVLGGMVWSSSQMHPPPGDNLLRRNSFFVLF